MEQYCYGVDIGGTGIKIVLFNAAGDLLEKWEISTRKTGNRKMSLRMRQTLSKTKTQKRA